MNTTAFIWDDIGNASFALFFEKDVANIKKAKELICCISKNEDRDKVPIKVTNLAKANISFISLLTQFVFWFVSKIIITKFCWNLAYKYYW